MAEVGVGDRRTVNCNTNATIRIGAQNMKRVSYVATYYFHE
jgi:hypothetical protein